MILSDYCIDKEREIGKVKICIKVLNYWFFNMCKKRNNRNVSIKREQSELACFAEREKRRIRFNLRSILLLFLFKICFRLTPGVL